MIQLLKLKEHQKKLQKTFELLSLLIGLSVGLLIIGASYFYKIQQYGVGFAIFGASIIFLLFFRSRKSITNSNISIELNPFLSKIFHFFIKKECFQQLAYPIPKTLIKIPTDPNFVLFKAGFLLKPN